MCYLDKCWYKNVCSLYGKNENHYCFRYLEMEHLCEQSRLPKNKWMPVYISPDDCDYDSFCKLAEIKDNIDKFVNNGKNLYIYSEITGNGKTTWAIKLLLKYFDSVWAGNGFNCRGLFIHVPTFLTRLKNFDSQDADLCELKKLIPDVDLVVWDDVASTSLSNYDHSQLLTYVDQRIVDDKSNIFTGNLGHRAMEKSLGVRLASRVWNSSTKIELKGSDKRCENRYDTP